LGSNYLRKIPLDQNYKIDLERLERAISEDRLLGLQPFCIIANGGSARTGTVDPIEALSGIAKKNNVWLHIDGAYGVLAAMTPAASPLFKGIGLADSVSMDPHKWMNVPYESSCLLVREWSHLNAAFELVPDYLGTLQPNERESFSCHFDFTQSDKALKVWYALQLYGVKNYSRLFENHLQLTKHLVAKLKGIPAIERYHEPDLSICCFRYVPEELKDKKDKYLFYLNNLNRAIELTLKEQKDMLITTTSFGRQVSLRICMVSYRIQSQMIDNLIEAICTAGQNLDCRMRRKPVSAFN
jgi:aromatic-L-amino-acid decarboxylase